MNKTDLLFVRACKSLKPETRLKSVYGRFYLRCENPEIYIAKVLIRICEENNLISISKLIDEMSPENYWKFRDKDYWPKIFDVLLSTIRLTEVKKFEGYAVPKKFR